MREQTPRQRAEEAATAARRHAQSAQQSAISAERALGNVKEEAQRLANFNSLDPATRRNAQNTSAQINTRGFLMTAINDCSEAADLAVRSSESAALCSVSAYEEATHVADDARTLGALLGFAESAHELSADAAIAAQRGISAHREALHYIPNEELTDLERAQQLYRQSEGQSANAMLAANRAADLKRFAQLDLEIIKKGSPEHKEEARTDLDRRRLQIFNESTFAIDSVQSATLSATQAAIIGRNQPQSPEIIAAASNALGMIISAASAAQQCLLRQREIAEVAEEAYRSAQSAEEGRSNHDDK